MKFLPAVLLLPLFPAIALPADAPRNVDQNLRARVNEFYDLIIQHKTRAAEALVADDTKDYYYDSQKPDMESFEIAGITYGPQFRTAEVTLSAKMHMLFPGAGPQTVPMKFPSTWKIDHGKWCWYIDRTRLTSSPFGQFHSGTAGEASKPIVTPGMLQAAVRPDRNQVPLDVLGKEASAIRFTNSLPGPVKLNAPNVAGLKIDIVDPNIGAGKSADVSVRYDPNSSSRPSTITFTVEPTGQQIPIQIFYSVNNN